MDTVWKTLLSNGCFMRCVLEGPGGGGPGEGVGTGEVRGGSFIFGGGG
jgi:hypothetical protein